MNTGKIPGTIYDVYFTWYLVRMCQVYKTVPGKVILVRMIRTDVKYGLYCVLCNVLQRCLKIWGRRCSFCVNVMYVVIPKVLSIRQKGDSGFCVCFPDFCHPHRHILQGENIGMLINHELPIYIRYLRTALNECTMLLTLLAIWTNADYSWPKPLVLCRRQEMVWCRQPIGAHGAFVCMV